MYAFADCLFGDKLAFCQGIGSVFSTSHCDVFSEQCCDTCKRHDTAKKESAKKDNALVSQDNAMGNKDNVDTAATGEGTLPSSKKELAPSKRDSSIPAGEADLAVDAVGKAA
jgi:hypothetical protein